MTSSSKVKAFPSTELDDDGTPFTQHFGMTLRDWFAGQALAGILANNSATRTHIEWNAAQAYAHADAMMEVRDGQEDWPA